MTSHQLRPQSMPHKLILLGVRVDGANLLPNDSENI